MATPFAKTESNGKLSLAEAVLRRCESLGVVLSIAPGGGLAFDAPADALDDELLIELREQRAELLAMLPSGRKQSPFILCPWCRLGDRLLDDPEGIQCQRCRRLAWRMVGDSIERVDYVEPVLRSGCRAEPESQGKRTTAVGTVGARREVGELF